MLYKNSLQELAPAEPLLTDLEQQVRHYTDWLNGESELNTLVRFQDAHKQYTENALNTVTMGDQVAHPFAPFRQQYSAFQTLTRGQATALIATIAVIALGLR